MTTVRLLWLLLGALAVNAQDPGDVVFDFRADAGFGDATAGLREFLRARHLRTAHAQHFCAVGFQDSGNREKRVWITWAEGRKALLWAGSPDRSLVSHSLANSRVTDLVRDVVPAEADLKGSTYLVTRAWVSRLAAECESRGVKYEVRAK